MKNLSGIFLVIPPLRFKAHASLSKMASFLPISDEAIRLLLLGNPNDIDVGVTLLWNHLAPGLAAYALSILPKAQSGDCMDVVSDAFAKLLGNPSGVKTRVEGFLREAVKNNALSRCRKHEVRERSITDPVILEQLLPTSIQSPDAVLLGKENQVADKQRLNAVFAALEAAAEEMGPKEKEVATIMLRILRGNARWPTAERIHEDLQKTDRALSKVTVKDRRKEVMKIFNPILMTYGRNPIGE